MNDVIQDSDKSFPKTLQTTKKVEWKLIP